MTVKEGEGSHRKINEPRADSMEPSDPMVHCVVNAISVQVLPFLPGHQRSVEVIVADGWWDETHLCVKGIPWNRVVSITHAQG
jgi:hypothetical protein